MKDLERSKLMIGMMVVLTIVSLLSAYMSYKALALSRQAEQDRTALGVFKGRVDQLGLQIATLQGKMSKFLESPWRPMDMGLPQQGWNEWNPPGPTDAGPGPKPKGAAPDMRKAGKEGTVPPQPPSANADSPKQAASPRDKFIARNVAQRQADFDRYGESVAVLYGSARTMPGPGGETKESSAAFQQLLTQYPEANATGLAIGERALQSALQANALAAEQYYQMLTANENFSSIVTERGVEVMPALQGFLADQYIQQGRFEEAEALIQSLETNYGSEQMATPGRFGEQQFRPVTDVTTRLREQLTTRRSGS